MTCGSSGGRNRWMTRFERMGDSKGGGQMGNTLRESGNQIGGWGEGLTQRQNIVHPNDLRRSRFRRSEEKFDAHSENRPNPAQSLRHYGPIV